MTAVESYQWPTAEDPEANAAPAMATIGDPLVAGFTDNTLAGITRAIRTAVSMEPVIDAHLPQEKPAAEPEARKGDPFGDDDWDGDDWEVEEGNSDGPGSGESSDNSQVGEGFEALKPAHDLGALAVGHGRYDAEASGSLVTTNVQRHITAEDFQARLLPSSNQGPFDTMRPLMPVSEAA